ncbi:HYR-like domain-containing protein, partial [Hanstruepera ponticola]|uniref:HYR-like domain-containing protein n=1 Tax=Hanstruepera ponticola TaxID=2042995 RepID=UPI0017800116
CLTDVPAPGDLTATDNCAGDITVTGSDSTDNSDPCNVVITRSWTFTDSCNNETVISQTITVADTIDPVAPSAPADIAYQCLTDVPAPGDLTATDNCAGDITVTGSDSTDNSDPCNVVITRTWTFTDSCNNETVISQTITVADTIDPVAPSAPADIAYQCLTDVPAPGDLTATDNCAGDITVTGSDSTDNSDPCNVVITRTWTFTDNCNNETVISQTITVADTIAPTITTVGADQTVLCDGLGNTNEFQAWLDTNAGANATDNCGTVTWTNEILNVIDQCGETSRTLVRFTATDDCNNSSSTTALFTIIDLVPPTLDSPATDLTVECDGSGNTTDLNDWLNTNGGGTATDICGNVTWTNDFTGLSDDCGETGSATVTFTATDDCGNAVSTSATFTIQDTQAPAAPNAPADITYECIGDVPAAGDLTASDDCSGNITVTGVDVTDNSNPCNIVITRTWTFTDDCNNSSSVSQTITVTDTIAPTIDTPASDIAIECDGSGNNGAIEDWLNNNGGAVASDNCSTVTWTNNYGGTASDCSTAIEVIFTATDACGNSISTTASYAIQDTEAPEITPASDETVECDGSGNLTDLNNWLDTNGGATATDDCSAVSWSNDFTGLSDDCGETGSAAVTFTATDGCGNSSSVSATFTIEDTTPPTAPSAPADITYECIGDVPAVGDLTATDICSGDIVATAVDSIDNTNPCNIVITRTWTFTDDCNNSSSVSQTITVADTIPPVAPGAPADITYECVGDVPAAGDLTAVDNCAGDIVATAVDATDDTNPCNVVITRTWTFIDDCNNSSSVSQTITITDTVPPVAPSAPADITYECIGDVPAASDLIAIDNCTGDIVATAVDTTDDTNPCNVVITRTWTFTDDCNNSSSVSQTITVTDTIAPTIDTPASDIAIECDGSGNNGAIEDWLNNNGGAVASDNCSTVTWTNNYGGTASDCSAAIEVIFTATDACGNSISTTASYAIQDTEAPEITPASDETVECNGSGNLTDLNNWLDTNGGATATDDCSAISWSHDFTALSDDCGETGSATVTFTATDGCGNSSSVSATFTIEDTTPPTAPSAPADIAYECIGDVPAAGDLTATDECSGDITVTGVDVTDDSNPCNVIITRTWTFTDDCNNSSSVSQTITVADTIAPTASNPAGITVECIGDVPAADISVVTDAADNCSVPVVAFVSDSSDGQSCPETITRTYSVTDDCNNSINVTQTIIVGDTIAPTASNPAGITVECIGDVPAADISVVTDAADNCSVPVVAFVSDSSDGQSCPETITRTYSVTDDCNNSINVTQTIIVGDTIAPTASNPAGITVECIGDVPAADISVVTDAADNCSVPVVAFVSDSSDGQSCPETITRTYSVTDDCNNSINVTQTIIVGDTIAPTASNPAGITVECIGDVPAADI